MAQAIAARNGTDLVLADGRVAAQAMVSASRTIPIVAVTGDPVALGLAVSLAHPGGNVTGIATLSNELGAKQLELLREIVPSARRIGVVNVSFSAAGYRALEDRAASLGVMLRRLTFARRKSTRSASSRRQLSAMSTVSSYHPARSWPE